MKRKMIEKTITVLIPKNEEDYFDKLIKGFKNFTLSSYEKTNHYNYHSLFLQICSTKKLKKVIDLKKYLT